MAKKSSNTKIKPLTLSFIFLSLSLLVFTLNLRPPPPCYNHIIHHAKGEYPVANSHPKWYNVISQEVEARKIKVGLINIDHEVVSSQNDLVEEVVTVDFDRVDESHQWKDFFPEWIDEEIRWHTPKCPEIPMPNFKDYHDVDVVVARVPCGGSGGGGGVRDVFRLQVNLMVANLLVRSGWRNDRTVYAVFVGSCGPMWEIFRCDDLLWHEGDYWVYKPNLGKLKHKLLMPVGSCELVPHGIPSEEEWEGYRGYILNGRPQKPREAYVTVLHSSEDYVCGAIVLAQSIIQSNSTRDLVLLADKSLSQKSLNGLQSAGWKVKLIERIRSPHAEKKAYNKWNYSKLRIWELVEYEKLIFIDSDLLVLRNIDHFFAYPQLSARGNSRVLFNSGVMVVEPSKCTFNNLMRNRYDVVSYNGGDQGFLNEMFTWWHRLPSKVNHLKIFLSEEEVKKREVPKDVYTIHYLGKKPWLCYVDYDCNWDMAFNLKFSSDEAHALWWQVYEVMPKNLQPYCALTEGMDAKLRKWRKKAKKENFSNGHWKIEVKDPRMLNYVVL